MKTRTKQDTTDTTRATPTGDFCQCFVRCVLRVRVFMNVDASHEGTALQTEPVPRRSISQLT